MATNRGNNSRLGSRKILLADDDADVVSTFKIILEMNDFEVDAYTNPLSALSNFKSNEFGLLSNVEVCFITAFEDYHEGFREIISHVR